MAWFYVVLVLVFLAILLYLGRSSVVEEADKNNKLDDFVQDFRKGLDN